MFFKDYLQNMTTLKNLGDIIHEQCIKLLDAKFEEHPEMQAKFTDFCFIQLNLNFQVYTTNFFSFSAYK